MSLLAAFRYPWKSTPNSCRAAQAAVPPAPDMTVMRGCQMSTDKVLNGHTGPKRPVIYQNACSRPE